MSIRNRTSFFYSHIFPSIKRIKHVPKTPYQDKMNSIIFKNIVIYAKMGEGKSELCRRIAEEGIKKYGIDNFSAQYVEEGELEWARQYGLTGHLVNMLFIDNLTSQKISKDELREFFHIRHHWRDITNRNYGLLLTVLAVHRFHGLATELRTNIDALIVKNSPTSPFDRSIIKKFITQDGIELLETLEKQREEALDLKRYSIFNIKSTIGVLDAPLATKNYLQEVCVPVSKEIYNLFKGLK